MKNNDVKCSLAGEIKPFEASKEENKKEVEFMVAIHESLPATLAKRRYFGEIERELIALRFNEESI